MRDSELALRREFLLPEDDVAFLDTHYPDWESVKDGTVLWLLVHDVELPDGLTPHVTTLAIRIVPGYPSAALDMVYVSPIVSRADGRAIPAVSSVMICGAEYQQWSRHYSAAHPWRPDVDNIETHLRAASEWFGKAAR